MLTAGTVLAGYRIERLVGRGGMGVVYVATQVRLDRPVALKLISPELADDPTLRERFVRESRVAAAIEHPNVVPIYEADEADGVLFIAMRYVEGDDLRQILDREGRLRPDTATRIVDQVAAALDAAHARNLIHRDVKPGNILLAEGPGPEHAYLSDFGLTKRIGSDAALTASGGFVGTLDYIAPEVVRGDRIDRRADVYALGAVLFETLTGAVPFPRDNDVAKLWAHANESPPPLGEVAPDLPAELDRVVRRAMAKDPDERYPAAGALARAAAEVLTDDPRRYRGVTTHVPKPTPAAEASPDVPRKRALTRRRIVAATLVALMLGASVAIAVALEPWAEDRPQPVGPRRPAGWSVEAATADDRSSVPPAVLNLAERDIGVLVDGKAGRRYVAATVPANRHDEAQRRALEMESHIGVVDGRARYNAVIARFARGATFVGRRDDGRLAAIWLSSAPPDELLSSAAEGEPARGKLISAGLAGLQCRATSANALSARFSSVPPRGAARREASTCRIDGHRIGVEALEPAAGVDANAPNTRQNHDFVPNRFPDVSTRCGTMGGKRIDGRWVMSFHVNDSVTGRARWAFILFAAERRPAERLSCRLVDIAADL